MRRRLLRAMTTVEKWLCHKTLPGSISIGFSLSISYLIESNFIFFVGGGSILFE